MVGGATVRVGVSVGVSVGAGVEVGGSIGGGNVGGNGSVAVLTGVAEFAMVGGGASTAPVDKLQLKMVIAKMTMMIIRLYVPVMFVSRIVLTDS